MYLYRTPIVMKEQRSGLPALMREAIKADPFSGSVHLFTGKRRDRIKILWWNRNGFVVWLKVIEGRQKFPWRGTCSMMGSRGVAEQLS